MAQINEHRQWRTPNSTQRCAAGLILVLSPLYLPVCLRGLRSAFQRVVRNNTVAEEFDQWLDGVKVLAAIVWYNEYRIVGAGRFANIEFR